MRSSHLSFLIILFAALVYTGCNSVNSPNSNAEINSTDISTAEAHAGSIVYADANATGADNGSSPADAYDTIQEAVDHAAIDGDIVMLLSDFTLASQVTISDPLTLDGNGKSVDAAFSKTDNSNNSAIGIISGSNVTVQDLSLTASGDAPWPNQLHGVNVYESTNVNLENLNISGFEGSGISINSSRVEAGDITTSGNGWHGINVDQRTNNASHLTIKKTSNHDEALHIYLDNVDLDVGVDDVDNQYEYEEFDNLNDVRDGVVNPRTAGLYTLKKAEVKDDCKEGGWEAFGFKNQGQCVRYVNSGKDSR